METAVISRHFIHHLLLRSDLARHGMPACALETAWIPTADELCFDTVTSPLTTVFENTATAHLPWSSTGNCLFPHSDGVFKTKCYIHRDVVDLPLYYLWSMDERKRRADGVSNPGKIGRNVMKQEADHAFLT